MAWVIKDLSTNEYYRQRLGAGWYSTDINNARFYTDAIQARRVIDKADHHVTFPYNRDLKVIEVKIVEI
jgi:hypothetical protein